MTQDIKTVPGQSSILGGLGLLCLVLLWSWGHAAWGDMVLPSWPDVLRALWLIVSGGDALSALGLTVLHAAGGALAAIIIGMFIGIAAGRSRFAAGMLVPVMTVLLGIPPVGWVVLALLWFGPGLYGPLFTVMIATMPIVFLATLQGMRARSPALKEMAEVFHLPPLLCFTRIMMPEIMVPLMPALSTVLALSWKVALTAELLGDGSGMGGRIAAARAYLDLPETMAWLLIIVIFVLISDAALSVVFRQRLTVMPRRKTPGMVSCPGIHGVAAEGGKVS